MWIILVAAATFGLCFLVDKLYTHYFRGKTQHRSGLSVRPNKRYGSLGFFLTVIGIVALLFTAAGNTALIIGSCVLILAGLGMVAYYLSSGIYYDADGFLVEAFGKKRRQYRYGQIRHQMLYVLQGGGIIVELHMADGTAVQVVSNMTGYDQFLDHAFRCWCCQKGLDPDTCQFHDPANHIWFPDKEETGCTFPA